MNIVTTHAKYKNLSEEIYWTCKGFNKNYEKESEIIKSYKMNLGDIVYVEVETLDETLEAEAVFGTVEAVKTVSDLFMPLSGTIIAFNALLEEAPETVNEDAYGSGWMIKIKLNNSANIKNLLDAEAYTSLVTGG